MKKEHIESITKEARKMSQGGDGAGLVIAFIAAMIAAVIGFGYADYESDNELSRAAIQRLR